MKAIMMSIQPKWCYLIAHGDKTIEVRKTKPKLETPFKVYMYCTKGKPRVIAKFEDDLIFYNGYVMGEFVCDKIINYDVSVIACAKWEVNGADVQEELRYNAGACLSAEEMFEYGKGKPLYGLHISQLKIYDEPKELSEFRKPCIYHHYCCAWCRFGNIILSDDEEEFALYHGGSYETFDTVCLNHVKRPPQSWCYVEAQDDDKTK